MKVTFSSKVWIMLLRRLYISNWKSPLNPMLQPMTQPEMHVSKKCNYTSCGRRPRGLWLPCSVQRGSLVTYGGSCKDPTPEFPKGQTIPLKNPHYRHVLNNVNYNPMDRNIWNSIAGLFPFDTVHCNVWRAVALGTKSLLILHTALQSPDNPKHITVASHSLLLSTDTAWWLSVTGPNLHNNYRVHISRCISLLILGQPSVDKGSHSFLPLLQPSWSPQAMRASHGSVPTWLEQTGPASGVLGKGVQINTAWVRTDCALQKGKTGPHSQSPGEYYET